MDTSSGSCLYLPDSDTILILIQTANQIATLYNIAGLQDSILTDIWNRNLDLSVYKVTTPKRQQQHFSSSSSVRWHHCRCIVALQEWVLDWFSKRHHWLALDAESNARCGYPLNKRLHFKQASDHSQLSFSYCNISVGLFAEDSRNWAHLKVNSINNHLI